MSDSGNAHALDQRTTPAAVSSFPVPTSAGGGEAGLRHADRGEEVRDPQRVDDEARPVPGADHGLAEHPEGALRDGRDSLG
ncbi:hypothetical protein ACQPZG_31235 [Streptomyces sp. CA-294286]|uniref:hypothetical protein n=1 Tax=Streptomyces sp. CA-294286 TaxID=3240070 RepID=UPI003D8EB1F2